MDWTPGRLSVRMSPASRRRKPAKKSAAKKSKAPVRKLSKPSKAAKGAKSARKVAKSYAKSARAPLHKKSSATLLQFSEVAPQIARAPAPRAASQPMRIALFGASGDIGSRIAEEALARGHRVTALVRHPDLMSGEHPNLKIVQGNVTDPLQVAVVGRSHDAIASAISPPASELAVIVHAAKALLAGARETGKPVVAVGGAGSLKTSSGRQLLATKTFPKDWVPTATAHRSALEAFKTGGEGVAWTVVSPSAFIEPGKRTGKFRLGTEQLLTDKKGNSRISMEDYAVAFVDAIESGQGQGRITVGY